MNEFSLDNSVGFIINKVAKYFKSELHRLFKENGYRLTPEHWAVMNRLWEKEGLSQSEIAELTFKDKANITRILDVMEKNKLIRRMPHEGDRRSYRIYLTETGRQLKTELIPFAIQVNQTATSGLTKEELAQLTNLLNKISSNFK